MIQLLPNLKIAELHGPMNIPKHSEYKYYIIIYEINKTNWGKDIHIPSAQAGHMLTCNVKIIH